MNATYNPDHVLIFKTSVITEADRLNITELLNADEEIDQWHIDLDDCDKVLRIVSATRNPLNIIELVNRKGYLCIELI
ncbi:MAG: hypothetical protein EOP49_12685 [Sphingobacteriales bacterium]|nr:MAG: hypothetical protein EOP49_12685 [Sphingobacteriales bacterium]